MSSAELLARLDHERQLLARTGEVITRTPHVTRLTIERQHAVVWSSLDVGNADEVILQEIEHHRVLGVSFEWKLFQHDAPQDLLERLRRHGFAIGACEAVMIFDLKRSPAWSAGHRVERIKLPAQVADYRAVAEVVFGKDYAFTSGELLKSLAAGSTDHLGYIAYDGQQPVSIGRLYTHAESRFGGLYGGGTLPSHRGRGFYRAVIAKRAKDATSLGAAYLQVDALPTSRPTLEKLGFVHLTDTWPCEWIP